MTLVQRVGDSSMDHPSVVPSGDLTVTPLFLQGVSWLWSRGAPRGDVCDLPCLLCWQWI